MTRLLRKRLFVRLSVAFGAVLVVSFGIVAALTILPLKRSLEDEVVQDLRGAADDTLADIQSAVNARCEEVAQWATLSQPGRAQGALPLGKLRQASFGRWLELNVVDEAGRIEASSQAGALSGQLDVDAGFLTAAQERKGPCLLSSPGAGRPLFIAAPITSPGPSRAWLVGLLDWRAIEEIVVDARLERMPQDDSAVLLLLDAQGRVLAGRPSVLNRLPGALERAAQVEPGHTEEDRLSDGGSYLFASGLDGTEGLGAPMFRLVAVRDARLAFSGLDARLQRILHAALLGLVLAASLSFLIARDLSDRLGRLREGAQRLTAGDLTVPMADGRDDELGALSLAFDAMAAEVSRVRSQLEHAVQFRTGELLRKTEELDQALHESRLSERAKSEFIANVSHEIRTPLNGIIGMTALALDGDLGAETRAHLLLVKSSADALMGLLNDVLDFSKMESRRLSLEVMSFELRASLADVVQTLGDRAASKGLTLTCRIDEDVPDHLSGDPGRLRQILVGLIDNAIKFTDTGRLDLEVRRAPEDPSGMTVQFTVRDTGIGIPPEEQTRIFAPFTQVDGSSTRRYAGVGLGLAIASRLVAMMNGRLWVESRPGAGSAFHFTARFQPGIVHPLGAAPGHDLHSVRILVVDDNPINRRVLQARFLAWGMRPETAEDGIQGLDGLRRAVREGDPFRLALLDMQMPGMDGFALAARVKGDPELRATRLILLTSSGQRGDAARCRAIGLEGYLAKPAREAELREAMLSILSMQGEENAPVTLVTRHALREQRGRSGILVPENGFARDSASRSATRNETIDDADLMQRVDGDRELLAELVRAFLDTAPQQLRAIDAAIERGEGAAVCRAAHTLKGSVGTFAAGAALQAVARVETLGEVGDLPAARAARVDLGQEIERLAHALTPYLAGNG